jgi:hypothetical protein
MFTTKLAEEEAQMKYGIHSRDYLARARQRLDDGSLDSLFYAAFELRCGVEARLQQYEEALTDITKTKSAGWRIPNVAGNIERAFRTGDKIVRVNVSDDTAKKVLYSFYYTPVNKNLRAMAGRINDLLHFPKEYRDAENPWWNRKRAFLERVYKELQKASIGTLLGVPLLNPETQRIHFQTELRPGEKIKDQISIGGSYALTVDYLDGLPEDQ